MFSQEISWLLKEKYHGQKTADFLADVTRLEAGEPLAFVIGSIPFLNTTISLDSKPLIPRPETEYWAKQVIDTISNQPTKPLHILDVCAGSGCIGVAILHDIPHVLVDFIELETKHLATINKNCRENGISKSRYRVLEGDVFSLKSSEGLLKYDYILSNPPYIDPALDRIETSVRLYEPKTALYGGIEGMEILARLITGAPMHLEAKGELWLEHEPEQSEAIEALAQSKYEVTTQKDQYGIKRFTKLVLQ